ncbi:hypothetical protein Tco_0949651 [Tanacetum coccineum]
MYLTASRPDIIFAICACARFQVTPKVSHLHAVKRIFRYLKGQPKLGLWYPKDSPFDLEAYTDSDYAGASLDRKSTVGVLVYAARHSLTAVRHKLMLLGITSYSKFVDEGGVECLPSTTIFEELARMGYEKLSQKLTFYKAFFSPQWKFLIHTILQYLSAKMTDWNEFSSTVVSTIICLATNQKFNFSKYILEGMLRNLDTKAANFLMYPRFIQLFVNQMEGLSSHHRKYIVPCHTKKIFANMRRVNKDFSGNNTPLFPTMVVQAQTPPPTITPTPTTTTSTPTPTPLPATTSIQSSQPQKQRVRRLTRKETEPTMVVDEAVHIESNDPLSGEDRLKLIELMTLCTQLSSRVLALETTKTAQAKKIAAVKKRAKRLERGKKSSSNKLKDYSSIADIDEDVGVTLENTTFTDKDLFGVHDLEGEEVFVDEEASKTIDEEMTLAQTLMEIKTKDKEIVIEEHSDSAPIIPSQQPFQVKVQDKGKSLQLQAEEEEAARKIAEWDDIQARIDAEYELAEQLQIQEQGELTVEEKLKFFVELMNKRKKHFTRLRAKQQRRKPLTKA